MAVIHFGVDMRTIGVGGGGYALPQSPANGWLCEIVKFENSTTRDGQNGKLDVHLRIIEGEHFGATGIWSLNLFNSNPDSRRISLEQLNSLFVINGYQISESADPDVLVGKQVRVVVGPRKPFTKDGREINTTQCKRALTLEGAPAATMLGKAVPLAAPGASAPVFGSHAPQVAPQAQAKPAQVATVAPTQGGFQPAPGSVPGWAQ